MSDESGMDIQQHEGQDQFAVPVAGHVLYLTNPEVQQYVAGAQIIFGEARVLLEDFRKLREMERSMDAKVSDMEKGMDAKMHAMTLDTVRYFFRWGLVAAGMVFFSLLAFCWWASASGHEAFAQTILSGILLTSVGLVGGAGGVQLLKGIVKHRDG